MVLLCASLCAGAQTSEIYKWVDSNGNVHYGDRPNGGGDGPVEALSLSLSLSLSPLSLILFLLCFTLLISPSYSSLPPSSVS